MQRLRTLAAILPADAVIVTMTANGTHTSRLTVREDPMLTSGS